MSHRNRRYINNPLLVFAYLSAIPLGAIAGLSVYLYWRGNDAKHTRNEEDFSFVMPEGTPRAVVLDRYGAPGNKEDLFKEIYFPTVTLREQMYQKDLWDCGTHVRLVMYNPFIIGDPVIYFRYIPKLELLPR
jgi:hypothetical protein